MKRILFLLLCVCSSLMSFAQPGKIFETQMPCRLLQDVTRRALTIYLPPSYEQDSQRCYPVLYLMHGGGESHTVWQRNGHLREVADSLIAAGEMEEMILVCPEGNEQNMMYFNAPWWKYEDYFFQELIPYIESSYRVRTDRAHRGIVGFSMGGGAATVYGVHHPELFALVYDISGYLRRLPMEWLKNDPSAEWRQQVIEDNNPVARILSGTDEEVAAWRQVDWTVSVGDHDFTLELNMELVRAFRLRGIDYRMHVGAGTHDWRYVAPAMAEALKHATHCFRRTR